MAQACGTQSWPLSLAWLSHASGLPMGSTSTQAQITAGDLQRHLRRLTGTPVLWVVPCGNKCFSCAINNGVSKDVV